MYIYIYGSFLEWGYLQIIQVIKSFWYWTNGDLGNTNLKKPPYISFLSLYNQLVTNVLNN